MTQPPPAYQNDWPLIDLTGPGELTVGRSRECSVRLAHVTISARHARLVIAEGNVEIEDLDSRYGTKVNGVFVRQSRLKKGDLIRFGSSMPYRFTGGQLRVEAENAGMAIHFSAVTLERGGRKLLDDVNLNIAAGSFTALIGPSGAGKSLVLGCMATTLLPTSGAISFDNHQLLAGDDLDYYREKLGVVPQEDLVHGALTVRENVRFAARLRLGGQNASEIEKRIDGILEDVGLIEHQHKAASVLSGGQRKRIVVAIELLMRPCLLLLDEPTSGLDPGMQARLMDMLRGLARQGITVVASTHTIDTLNYFDSVVVLAPRGNGTTVLFHGSPSELLPAFTVRDAADLFDKLAHGGNVTVAAGSNIPLPPAPSDAEKSTDTDMPLSLIRAGLILRPSRSLKSDFPKTLMQARVVASRSFLSFRRDKAAFFLAALQPPLLAILIILSQLSSLTRLTEFDFFLVISAIWLGMTIAVREFVRDRSLYLRDRLAGLSPNAFLIGKCMFVMTTVSVQVIALFAVARVLLVWRIHGDPIQLELYAVSAFSGTIAVASSGIGGALIGLTVSALAASEQAAISMLPLVILPLLLISRVAAGDGGLAWTDPESVYVPLANVRQVFSEKEEATEGPSRYQGRRTDDKSAFAMAKAVSMLISLPMLSRPALTVLDLPHFKTHTPIPVSVFIIEWIYLVTLLAVLFLTLWICFATSECRWRLNR